MLDKLTCQALHRPTLSAYTWPVGVWVTMRTEPNWPVPMRRPVLSSLYFILFNRCGLHACLCVSPTASSRADSRLSTALALQCSLHGLHSLQHPSCLAQLSSAGL